MKDLLLRARVVVRNSNMKISRSRLADCVKTLHQKVWSTIIFLHSTNQIIDFGVVVQCDCRQILTPYILQEKQQGSLLFNDTFGRNRKISCGTFFTSDRPNLVFSITLFWPFKQLFPLYHMKTDFILLPWKCLVPVWTIFPSLPLLVPSRRNETMSRMKLIN